MDQKIGVIGRVELPFLGWSRQADFEESEGKPSHSKKLVLFYISNYFLL